MYANLTDMAAYKKYELERNLKYHFKLFQKDKTILGSKGSSITFVKLNKLDKCF